MTWAQEARTGTAVSPGPEGTFDSPRRPDAVARGFQEGSPPKGPLPLPPAPPAPAPESSRTQVPPERPFHLPPRVGVLNQAPLTLEQTLAMALANNKNIDASRIDSEKSEYAVLAARGAFDPNVGATTYIQKAVIPVASSLGGSATGAVTSRSLLGDPQFSGSTPWYGGSYQMDLSSARSTTDNTFVQLNPQYPTSLNLSYTQPLWRNLLYDNNRHRLDVAKKDQSLSDEQFRQTVMQVVAQAEQAYWNLVYAYRNLDVQLQAVELGQQQDESNRRQEQQGLLAPIDVVAAQRQLATFEINAYSAQEALTNAENALKVLILPDRSDPLWSTALVPMTPVNLNPPVTPLRDAIDQALRNRPELAQVRISSQINQSDTRYYREQTKPQVDLVVSHINSGLAGTPLPAAPNPFISGFAPLFGRVNELSAAAGLSSLPGISFGGGPLPGDFEGGYGHSLAKLLGANFTTNEVQLRISLPLHNRTAQANLASSLAEGRRIRDQQVQTEQSVEANVRDTMQSMISAQARLEAARVQRESAEEQYQSEQRQFRAGTSTLFLVQQRQTDMVTARSQERRAESDLADAIAAFELATGDILQVHNIDLK
jgi:outer membrane protein TolC